MDGILKLTGLQLLELVRKVLKLFLGVHGCVGGGGGRKKTDRSSARPSTPLSLPTSIPSSTPTVDTATSFPFLFLLLESLLLARAALA